MSKSSVFLAIARAAVLGTCVLLVAAAADPAAAQSATMTFRPGPGANDGTDEGGPGTGKDAVVLRTGDQWDDGTNTNRNWGAYELLMHWNSTCNYFDSYSYLQFDVSALPESSAVTKVELSIWHRYVGGVYGMEPPTSTMVVRDVTAPWNEMTITYATRPPVSPTVRGSTTVNSRGNPGYVGYINVDITELYRLWRSGTLPNYGLRYSRSNGVCENGNANYAYSSDYAAEPDKRSALLITYTAEPEDDTPPVITATVNGPAGQNGWFVGDVSVTWTVSDDESEATSSGCDAQSVVTDTPGVTFTCSAESAGGAASESVTIRRDATIPTIAGARSPAANGSGWNNTPVAVTFTCADAMSGVASCVGDTTLAGEGAGQSVDGMVMDVAGNSASAAVGGINIDLTAPVLSVPAGPVVEAAGPSGTAVSYTVTAADGLDPTPSVSCTPASGSTFPIGVTTVGCTASDDAGNVSTASFVVTVNDVTTPGRMFGVGFVRGDGKAYHFAFDVRERARGGERGHFRLEVREERRAGRGRAGDDDDDGEGDDRRGGRRPAVDRFVARSVGFVAFSDDPSYRPGRPRRPQVDTVLFSGVGMWNGASGYGYEVFAADQGEPGRHRESVRITIRDAAGVVVAHVDGVLSGGNVQSVRIRH
jgi:hypothetical protein